MLVAVIAGGGGSTTVPDNATIADLSMANDTMSNAAGPPHAATSSPVAATWTYSTDENRVRGAVSYYARTTSINSLHRNAPCDGDNGDDHRPTDAGLPPGLCS